MTKQIHIPTLIDELEDINAHALGNTMQLILHPLRLQDNEYKPLEYASVEKVQEVIDIFIEKLTEQAVVIQERFSNGLDKNEFLQYELKPFQPIRLTYLPHPEDCDCCILPF